MQKVAYIARDCGSRAPHGLPSYTKLTRAETLNLLADSVGLEHQVESSVSGKARTSSSVRQHPALHRAPVNMRPYLLGSAMPYPSNFMQLQSWHIAIKSRQIRPDPGASLLLVLIGVRQERPFPSFELNSAGDIKIDIPCMIKSSFSKILIAL